MSDVVYRPIALPEETTIAIRKLMAYYGLRFGAIDMTVANNGDWYFLEINPNGQWAWLDMTAGANIAASFVKMFSPAAGSSG
jgi:glutathione synthase/RimK-type ligase-like ATP-grasp enzyme